MTNKPVMPASPDQQPARPELPLEGQDHDDSALDEALRETFPSSDPIAVSIEPLADKPN